MELRATYRLQLGPQLDFAGARALIPYLRELGVTHLYLSPSLQAAAGSTHGYDVVDPTRVSEELGGEEGLRELARAGLGIVLDIVPNHMGATEENRWWADPKLRARFFDIDAHTGFHRRFFDVDGLAAIRQELPEVFETTHAKVLQLVADGVIDGLRVDHPDGLADPAGYLQRLRSRGVARVWVEKILSSTPPGERLRDWPVSGTVGYDFLDDVAALFIDPDGERELTDLWTEISGDPRTFAQVAGDAKREQAQTTFAHEVAWLQRLGGRFSAQALVEALSSLPVYRTYVQPGSGQVDAADERAVLGAAMEAELADALLLRGDGRGGDGGGERGDGRGGERGAVPDEFVVRFQQTSPGVSAKGVEDTALYRHLRLLALNEVGGDPGRFGMSVDAFHGGNLERARRFPLGLLVTQTHDTKRSGDARARIGALAGMAARWRAHVMRWHEMAAALAADDTAGGGHASSGDEAAGGGSGPDFVEEYLIFQTLAGVWPIEPARLDAYLEKALREAKRRTSWVDPDLEHERAVKRLARALLTHRPFLEDFGALMEAVVEEGQRSALGQLLLKLTSPGVPDIFQGDELWRLSLVDPDNRRPVDWDERRAALARVRAGGPPSDADAKIFLIHRALELRARRPAAFAGAYTPLGAGPATCAFLRGEGEVLAVVTVRADGTPGGTELELPPAAAGRWREILADGEITLEPDASGRIRLEALGPGWRGLWLAERQG
jgi:(1->4)-alpha-D-glucan 1-alpha-D-glucosylmutase